MAVVIKKSCAEQLAREKVVQQIDGVWCSVRMGEELFRGSCGLRILTGVVTCGLAWPGKKVLIWDGSV